jgi:hypothetical protein
VGTAIAGETIAAAAPEVAKWAVQQSSDPNTQRILVSAGTASAVEQNNLVQLIPLVAEAASTALEVTEGTAAGARIVSAVKEVLEAGHSAYAVSQLLDRMGVNGDYLVHEAKRSSSSVIRQLQPEHPRPRQWNCCSRTRRGRAKRKACK